MTQNEAVYLAVVATFPNMDAVPETSKWTDAQKEQVYGMVLASFKSGACHKNSGGQTEADLIKYIPGLVNNHVRKDTRMNGGTKYEPKRPGSRSGSSDESVRAMRTLLSVTSDPTAKEQIQAAIDARLLELKPKTEIKVDALPEALRHLVPQS